MLKQVFLFIAVLFVSTVSAQTGERVMVDGKIFVPEGDEVSGLTVYNETSEKGTVTNRDGEFRIAVAINDRVTFRGIQFQEFTVIIDERIVENKELNVFIRESVTVLPEVVVSPDKLTGNVEVDVARLPVNVPDLPRMTPAELAETDYVFEPDSLTGPGKNEAMWQSQTLVVDMLNFVNIFKAIAGPFDTGRELPDREMDEKIRQMYDDHFFQEHLGLEREKINDFIFYAHENGLTNEMLQEGNEINLIDFLIEKSKEYKADRE